MKRRRCFAFGRGEVAVARREREPVRFAHRRRGHDAGGEIEVARKLRDHLELLKILLAEHGEVGRALDEKFCDHRRHAGKEVRPGGVFEAGLGRTFRYDLGGESAGIHGRGVGRPDEIGSECGERLHVGGERARIGLEVLVRRELRRIDEDRDDDAIGTALRQAHQGEVPLVQRAHGWNQRDPFTLRAPSRQRVS